MRTLIKYNEKIFDSSGGKCIHFGLTDNLKNISRILSRQKFENGINFGPK